MDRRTLFRSAPFLLLAGDLLAQDKNEGVETSDPTPLENELEKYPRCVICGMDRRKFHFARHLLHYADGVAQGTCSVQCVGECMLRERYRGFLAIYAPDFAAAAEPKPLFEVSSATYLIGSHLRGVMTTISKVSFGDKEAALQAKLTYGGDIANFAGAIRASIDEIAQGLIRRYDNNRERMLRKQVSSQAR